MSSIRLGWKLSVPVVLLVVVLAFSFSAASVNGAYTVTFDQTGLDASAIGTVVTVDNSAKTYADLPFKKMVDARAKVRYIYEANVLSSVSGKRYRLDTVSGPSSPIRVSKDTTVTGNYATQYSLTVTSPYGTPSGQGWYDAGSSAYATLANDTAIGSTGIQYVFTGWSGDASGTGLKSDAITMNGPKTAVADWKTQYYIAVTSAHDNPPPSAWVDAGSDFTASVTSPTEIVPNDYEWVCTGFSVDGGTYQSGTTYTFTDVQVPHSIDFAWKQQSLKPECWIQVDSLHGSPTSSQWVNQGGSLTVSVTSPAYDDGIGTRFRCTGYKIDDGSLQEGTTYTFTDVQADHKIEFQWILQYELVIDTNPSGISTISGSGWYDDEAMVTTGAAPTTVNSGGFVYTFSAWKKDGVVVLGNPISILMDGPHAVRAYYASTTPPETPETGNLSIYVKDSDNNPISGATVKSASQPSGQSQLNGVTDTNGYVAFNSILAGYYSVEASRSGYVASTKSVTVASDQTTTETINLARAINVIGELLVFVKDSNMHPIAGASITSTSQPSGATPLNGVTDLVGCVTFPNMAPGDYFILVSKTGYDNASKQVTVETQKVTTSTVLLQTEIGSSPSTATQPVSLWIYATEILALWAGAATVLVLFLRAINRDHKEEASQKPKP